MKRCSTSYQDLRHRKSLSKLLAYKTIETRYKWKAIAQHLDQPVGKDIGWRASVKFMTKLWEENKN